MMNRADVIRSALFLPFDGAAFELFVRGHIVEMAGSAGHYGVHIVSYFFSVGPMALSATTDCLIGMFKLGRPGMACQTGDFGMRG